jgi:predicted nuclease of predicted toxin-antitoxin system
MGYEASHLIDIGLLESSDSRIWDHAIANGAVIVTKDEDFVIRGSVSKTAPTIVWLRIGNCPNTKLLAWFEQEMTAVVAALDSGNRLIEIA